MSTNRTARGGWADPAKLERGPNGRALCRRCGTEVPAGRRTFCSTACVDEWSIRTNPGYARRKVKERDHGVCAACGIDCEAIRSELNALRAREWSARYGQPIAPSEQSSYWALSQRKQQEQWDRYPAFETRCDELGLSKRRRHNLNKSLWEADHITPVVEGGGECGLDNLRTLCWRCHAAETKALAGRRAKARRPQLELPKVSP